MWRVTTVVGLLISMGVSIYSLSLVIEGVKQKKEVIHECSQFSSKQKPEVVQLGYDVRMPSFNDAGELEMELNAVKAIMKKGEPIELYQVFVYEYMDGKLRRKVTADRGFVGIKDQEISDIQLEENVRLRVFGD